MQHKERDSTSPKELADKAEAGRLSRRLKDYGKYNRLENMPFFVLQDVYYTISKKKLINASKTKLAVAIMNFLSDWLRETGRESFWKIEQLPTEVLRACYYKITGNTIRGSKTKVARKIVQFVAGWVEEKTTR